MHEVAEAPNDVRVELLPWSEKREHRAGGRTSPGTSLLTLIEICSPMVGQREVTCAVSRSSAGRNSVSQAHQAVSVRPSTSIW